MFDTIVWATDGSHPADATLPLVTELAAVNGSKIVAVHVVELFSGGRFAGGPLYADTVEVERKIAEQVADLRAAGFVTELEVVRTRRHDTAAVIAEAASAAEADLIVVGSHRHAGTALLHPGVLGGLEHAARCPVLVVPLVPVGEPEPAIALTATSG